ncbi:MAG: MFS transporter [Candidatus Eremiobacterota bacterium]
MSTWLERWQPEDPEFWERSGKKVAWRTLILTTAALTLSFASWFMVSAIVVLLPGAGFKLSTTQLFWLAAMPGLSGGTLRVVNSFLIPIFGSRHVITATILLKLIPCIGLGLAVQNPETPFWVLLLLAFTAGIGGGDFSSYMPSTSLFFPKRLQGTALGVQAGIGNFGVSLAQFMTPWVVSFGLFATLAGGPQSHNGKQMWLQNAALWYIPLLILLAGLGWTLLRSVPIRATLREQLDIFGLKHTWLMTSLYIMTFGSFSGLSASFPLLIRELYGGFEHAPSALKYAFLGPLIGASTRVVFGFVSDKVGGAIVTHFVGIALVASSVFVTGFTNPTSVEQFPGFLFWMLALFFAAGVGNASTFRQIPVIFPPRQAAGVLGWTAAVAAFGAFVFPAMFGQAIARTGSPNPVFYALTAFYALNIGINWWYYTRKGAEKPC